MKKYVKFVLFGFVLNLFLTTLSFANAYSIFALRSRALYKLNKMDKVVEKIFNQVGKYKNGRIFLDKDRQLVRQIIQEYKSKITKTYSPYQVKRLYSEAIRRVILRTVGGITKWKSLKNEAKVQVDNVSDINKVVQILKRSLKKGENYKLFIKAKYPKHLIEKFLRKFDSSIKVSSLGFKSRDGYYYYKIIIPNKSLLVKELLYRIENGYIPERLLKFKIVEPKVVKLIDDEYYLNEILSMADLGIENNGKSYLNGEQTNKLWGILKMHADKYQKILREKGKVIRVGVIDTGIDRFHQDLKDNIYINPKEIAGNGIDDDGNGYIDDVWGYDFVDGDSDPSDEHYHGTHVAGTIGAEVNGKGVFGVDSNVKLLSLRVLDSNGYGTTYDIVEAIKYAADNGIDVINMSLGGNGDPNMDIMCNAIDYALSHGTITVVAAGNEDQNVLNVVPAGCKNAITVAAVDSNLEKAWFSNYGKKVDVSAPGVNIYSTVPNNDYKTLMGTSMASPHVAGLVAAILAFRYDLKGKIDKIKQILKQNTDPVKTELNKPIGGFVNMEKVMNYLGIPNDDNTPNPQPQPPLTGDQTNPEITYSIYTGIYNVLMNIVVKEDKSNLSFVEVKINSKTILDEDNLNSKYFKKQLDITTYLRSGVNFIEIYAKNVVGLTNYKKFKYFYSQQQNDDTPPVINMILTGDLKRGIADVFVNVIEDNSLIKDVEVYFNDTILDRKFLNLKRFAHTYRNIKLLKGNNIFKVIARNTYGKQSIKKVSYIYRPLPQPKPSPIIDRTPPEINLQVIKLKDDLLKVVLNVSDKETFLKAIKLYIDNDLLESYNPNNRHLFAVTKLLNTNKFREGEHLIKVVALNENNLQSFKEKKIFIKKRNNPNLPGEPDKNKGGLKINALVKNTSKRTILDIDIDSEDMLSKVKVRINNYIIWESYPNKNKLSLGLIIDPYLRLGRNDIYVYVQNKSGVFDVKHLIYEVKDNDKDGVDYTPPNITVKVEYVGNGKGKLKVIVMEDKSNLKEIKVRENGKLIDDVKINSKFFKKEYNVTLHSGENFYNVLAINEKGLQQLGGIVYTLK